MKATARLGTLIVQRRRPKLLAAATRLARHPEEAPPVQVTPEPEPTAAARPAGLEGVSDAAFRWLAGDDPAHSSAGDPASVSSGGLPAELIRSRERAAASRVLMRSSPPPRRGLVQEDPGAGRSRPAAPGQSDPARQDGDISVSTSGAPASETSVSPLGRATSPPTASQDEDGEDVEEVSDTTLIHPLITDRAATAGASTAASVLQRAGEKAAPRVPRPDSVPSASDSSNTSDTSGDAAVQSVSPYRPAAEHRSASTYRAGSAPVPPPGAQPTPAPRGAGSTGAAPPAGVAPPRQTDLAESPVALQRVAAEMPVGESAEARAADDSAAPAARAAAAVLQARAPSLGRMEASGWLPPTEVPAAVSPPTQPRGAPQEAVDREPILSGGGGSSLTVNSPAAPSAAADPGARGSGVGRSPAAVGRVAAEVPEERSGRARAAADAAVAPAVQSAPTASLARSEVSGSSVNAPQHGSDLSLPSDGPQRTVDARPVSTAAPVARDGLGPVGSSTRAGAEPASLAGGGAGAGLSRSAVSVQRGATERPPETSEETRTGAEAPAPAAAGVEPARVASVARTEVSGLPGDAPTPGSDKSLSPDGSQRTVAEDSAVTTPLVARSELGAVGSSTRVGAEPGRSGAAVAGAARSGVARSAVGVPRVATEMPSETSEDTRTGAEAPAPAAAGVEPARVASVARREVLDSHSDASKRDFDSSFPADGPPRTVAKEPVSTTPLVARSEVGAVGSSLGVEAEPALPAAAGARARRSGVEPSPVAMQRVAAEVPGERSGGTPAASLARTEVSGLPGDAPGAGSDESLSPDESQRTVAEDSAVTTPLVARSEVGAVGSSTRVRAEPGRSGAAVAGAARSGVARSAVAVPRVATEMPSETSEEGVTADAPVPAAAGVELALMASLARTEMLDSSRDAAKHGSDESRSPVGPHRSAAEDSAVTTPLVARSEVGAVGSSLGVEAEPALPAAAGARARRSGVEPSPVAMQRVAAEVPGQRSGGTRAASLARTEVSGSPGDAPTAGSVDAVGSPTRVGAESGPSATRGAGARRSGTVRSPVGVPRVAAEMPGETSEETRKGVDAPAPVAPAVERPVTAWLARRKALGSPGDQPEQDPVTWDSPDGPQRAVDDESASPTSPVARGELGPIFSSPKVGAEPAPPAASAHGLGRSDPTRSPVAVQRAAAAVPGGETSGEAPSSADVVAPAHLPRTARARLEASSRTPTPGQVPVPSQPGLHRTVDAGPLSHRPVEAETHVETSGEGCASTDVVAAQRPLQAGGTPQLARSAALASPLPVKARPQRSATPAPGSPHVARAVATAPTEVAGHRLAGARPANKTVPARSSAEGEQTGVDTHVPPSTIDATSGLPARPTVARSQSMPEPSLIDRQSSGINGRPVAPKAKPVQQLKRSPQPDGPQVELLPPTIAAALALPVSAVTPSAPIRTRLSVRPPTDASPTRHAADRAIARFTGSPAATDIAISPNTTVSLPTDPANPRSQPAAPVLPSTAPAAARTRTRVAATPRAQHGPVARAADEHPLAPSVSAFAPDARPAPARTSAAPPTPDQSHATTAHAVVTRTAGVGTVSTAGLVAASPIPGTQHTPAANRLGANEVDDLYESLVERLRRDLLLERERMGSMPGF
jgi:hypothetical protein